MKVRVNGRNGTEVCPVCMRQGCDQFGENDCLLIGWSCAICSALPLVPIKGEAGSGAHGVRRIAAMVDVVQSLISLLFYSDKSPEAMKLHERAAALVRTEMFQYPADFEQERPS